MQVINKIVYWLPRVLSICFVLFLSLFALDVFREYSGWQIVPALFMHLIPSLVLLTLIIIAWKHELVGTAAFVIAAILYVVMVGLHRPLSWYVTISGTSVIIGILFLLSWLQVKKP